jgi:hypothetical protein
MTSMWISFSQSSKMRRELYSLPRPTLTRLTLENIGLHHYSDNFSEYGLKLFRERYKVINVNISSDVNYDTLSYKVHKCPIHTKRAVENRKSIYKQKEI